MSHDLRTVVPAPVCLPFTGRTRATSWGDLSADQADGFAPSDDTDVPGPDLNDDRGYGHGV